MNRPQRKERRTRHDQEEAAVFCLCSYEKKYFARLVELEQGSAYDLGILNLALAHQPDEYNKSE